MRKVTGGIVALGALAVMGATEVAGQQVEAIMRARERLELTEAQVESLDALRREAVLDRTAEMAELQEMRSQLEAGQIQRSELMAFMEERRAGRQEAVERQRERVEAILSEDQLETLQQMRQRQRRVGARPGGRPGMDGPGFAPRGRAGLRGLQGPRRGPPVAAPRGFAPRGRFSL
jgi:hypothetical protein